MMSSKHKAEDYKYWDISAAKNLRPADYSKGYYLYVMCKKEGTNGSFILSDQPKVMDPNDGYYYFLYGVLNSEYNGERSFVALNGFTEITPGRITVPKIVSPGGKTYFDVAKGEIAGKIVFLGKNNEKSTVIDGGKIINSAIDTDNLTVKNIDTRSQDPGSTVPKDGVVISRGYSAIKVYDRSNHVGVQVGDTGHAVIKINNQTGEGLINIDYLTGFSYLLGAHQACFHTSGITMPRNAVMNMPGVLCAGKVNGDASNGGQWGCVTCRIEEYNKQDGRYKMIHNLNHTDYYVTATPITNPKNATWNKMHAVILEKTSEYVAIAIIDSGTENSAKAFDFDFMICGKTALPPN